MANLIVPDPALKPVDVLDGWARVDKPIKVECGQVKFPNGSKTTIIEATKFSFYIFRLESGQVKIWDKEAETWKLENQVAEKNREFNMLMYDETNATIPWKGLFVGMGERYIWDDNATAPQYYIRCCFEATDANGNSYSGWSNPSNYVKPMPMGFQNRVGIDTEQRDLRNAKWIRMFVKDTSKQVIGEIKLERVSGIGEVDIVSYNPALTRQSSITLNREGDVEIVGGANSPATKARIKLNKDGELVLKGLENDATKNTQVKLAKNGKVHIAIGGSEILKLETGKVTLSGELHVGHVRYVRKSDNSLRWL